MSRPFRVLLVCEGNVCRSPWAEIAFRRAWPPGAHGTLVTASAGTRAADGQSAHPLLRPLTAHPEEHQHLDRHRARRIDAALVRGQDLVLVMERRHRADLLESMPTALHRTFTLGEADRLVRTAPPTADERGRPLHEVLARRRRPQRVTADEDLEDPAQGTAEDFRHMGRRVGAMADAIVPFIAAVTDTDTDTTRRHR
jgi:protein-tyrosine phosphatase